MVALDLPAPSAGLEALTCWARGERRKGKKIRKAKIYKP